MKRTLTLPEAEQLLQLPPIYDDETARFCYGVAMRAEHPDHGGSGARIELIREARAVVLARHEDTTPENTACKPCKGTGRVRSRFGVRACVSCGGTGDRQ